MTRLSSVILATISFLTLTGAIVESQEQGAHSRVASGSQRPSVTLVRQQASSVTLKISVLAPIPEKPGMVKIAFKAKGPKTVKGYHFHYEENFVDLNGTRGSIVSESTSLRTLGREESMYAHVNAEIKVWVSEVEFMDGSRWKSSLIPKLSGEK